MRLNIGYVVLLICISLFFQACDSSGKSGSQNEYSTAVPAPKKFSAIVFSANEVELLWVNQSSQKVEIERRENGGAYKPLDTVGARIAQYMDVNVSVGNTYDYRIRSFNNSGRSDYRQIDGVQVRAIDACNPAPPVTGNAQQANFFDIPISGLVYSSANFYSVTSTKSSYLYDENTTKFLLGYVPVGSISNAEHVRLANIVESKSSELMNINTINFLRLMMAIDKDADNSNGIQIPCAISSLSGRIDFSLAEEQFILQETVTSLTAGKIIASYAEVRDYYVDSVRRRFVGDYRVHISLLHDGFIPYSGDLIFTFNSAGQLVNLDIFGNFRHFAIDSISFSPQTSLEFKVKLDGLIVGILAIFNRVRLDGFIQPDFKARGDARMTGLLGSAANGDFSGGKVK